MTFKNSVHRDARDPHGGMIPHPLVCRARAAVLSQAYNMRSRSVARIATTEAREQLAELVNAVAYGGMRIVLQRHGRHIAALVSIDDLQRLGVRLQRDVPEWEGAHPAGPD